MNATNPQFIGWTAIAAGVVGAVGLVSLILFFIVGGPFGTINDILAIPVAFLILPLILSLYRIHAVESPALSLIALVAGVGGFLLLATGSALLVIGRIDFRTSLIYASAGLGLVGLWLLLNGGIAIARETLPRGVAWAAVFLAVGPCFALLAMFRLDSLVSLLMGLSGQAPMGQISPLVYPPLFLGVLSYALLPLWIMWIGRLFLTGQATSAVAMAA